MVQAQTFSMNTKKYVFKPYLQCFPTLFNQEKERIVKHLDQDIMIEHVGSTAIPGLGGKGIIRALSKLM